MNAALPDARVSGYEWMEESIAGLPDKNDRHVVAAATHGQASVIVTFNLKDFPSEHLPGSLFSQSPDDFLLDLLDLPPISFGARCTRYRSEVVVMVRVGRLKTFSRDFSKKVFQTSATSTPMPSPSNSLMVRIPERPRNSIENSYMGVGRG